MIRYFHKYRIMKQEDVILALGALAQETRLQVFRALVRAHSPDPAAGGLAAGALAEALGVAQPTLSFHLKELARAGLIQARREGRSIIYRAELGAMQALTQYLLEDCCGGACGSVQTLSLEKECV